MIRQKDKNIIKENKTLKILGNIGFTVFMIIMIILIFITVQSRLTGREPSLLGHRIYVVDSGSMSPTIKVDSMIIVKEIDSKEIEKGDIVTYYGLSNSTKVTHRIVEVKDDGEHFITKGDANDTVDPMPLEGEKIVGKVSYSIPFIGKIFRGLSSKLGISLIITLGILWIIVPKILLGKGKKENF